MVIYTYARGAPFENLVNGYMSSGQPLDPFEIVPAPKVGELGNFSSTANVSIS